MAGVYYDENGIPHADDGSGRMEQFGVGAIPPPPPVAAGAAPFVGTPSQAPAGFSGASPLTATPSGASGSWDGPSAPAAPDAGGLIDVEGNGATAAPAAGAAGIGTSVAPAAAAGFGMDTKTVTTSGGMTADAQAGLLGSMADINAATVLQQQAQNNINRETSIALDQKQLATQQFQRQEAEKQANIEKARLDWDMKIKSADDKFRGASVDSGRMWRDSSTGSKIAAGVGIMLGALGQALTGQDNPAIKMIERAIDQDIDIQKANMEKAGKEAGMTRSAYSTYLQATGSEAAARNQMHLLALQNIDASLASATAKQQDTLVAANAERAKADLKMKVQERIAEKSTYQQVKTQERLAGPKPITPGTSHWNDAVGKDMMARKEVLTSLDRLDAALADPKKAEKFMGPFDSRMLALAGKAGFEVSPEYIEYKTEAGVLVAGILKVMSGVGVNEAEYARWAAMLPTVEKNPENAKRELAAFAKKQREDYELSRAGYMGNIAAPESKEAFGTTFPSYGPGADAVNKQQNFNAK